MNSRARGQATAQRDAKKMYGTDEGAEEKHTTSGGDGQPEGRGEMEDSEEEESADGGENNVEMKSQTAIKSREPLRERDQ